MATKIRRHATPYDDFKAWRESRIKWQNISSDKPHKWLRPADTSMLLTAPGLRWLLAAYCVDAFHYFMLMYFIEYVW